MNERLPQICSQMRSGTHLLMATLWLNLKMSPQTLFLRNRHGLIFTDHRGITTSQIPWGKLFRSHRRFHKRRHSRTDSLYVMRNPLNVLLSQWRLFGQDVSFQDFATHERIVNWRRHVMSYLNAQVPYVRYEDLVNGQAADVVERVATRFGLNRRGPFKIVTTHVGWSRQAQPREAPDVAVVRDRIIEVLSPVFLGYRLDRDDSPSIRPSIGKLQRPATPQPTIAPVYERKIGGCDFLGLRLQQNLFAYPTWNYVLLQERPRIVIELGTSRGGFSALLGMTCRAIDAELHTFDSKCPEYQHLFDSHGVRYHQQDVFSEEGRECIRKLISLGKAVILCDNGRKINELRQCTPWLKKGDIIGVHDYLPNRANRRYWGWSEVRPSVAVAIAEQHSLDRYRPEWFDPTAWLVFQKR